MTYSFPLSVITEYVWLVPSMLDWDQKEIMIQTHNIVLSSRHTLCCHWNNGIVRNLGLNWTVTLNHLWQEGIPKSHHMLVRTSETFFAILWSILDLSDDLLTRIYGFTQISIVTESLTTNIWCCTCMTSFASVIMDKQCWWIWISISHCSHIKLSPQISI